MTEGREKKMYRSALPVLAALLAATPALRAIADSMSGMSGMSDAPARFAVAQKVRTTNGAFSIDVVSVPKPIPYQKYFTLRLTVLDGSHPGAPLPGAKLTVNLGMRHGMKAGFAHGMQSTPLVQGSNGTFTVKGLYFTMMGAWTMEATVSDGGRTGTADIALPCCGT